MTPRRGAIVATFVANGLGGPSFLARIPERQEDLDLSDAGLGLVLVGLALGALLASRAAGRAVGAVGSRHVAVGAGLALGATLWLAGVAPSAPALFIALLAIGAADAAMDIAMNTNGAAFEVRAGRSVLHGLHAAWSVGALGAGLIAALAASSDVPLGVHLALVGAAIAGAVVVARPGLVADDREVAVEPTVVVHLAQGRGVADDHPEVATRPRSRRWRGPLAVIAGATVAGAFIEGAPADWGAVQLERFGVERGASSLALAAFMAGMVVGRLVGDRLTDRYGGSRLLRSGMILVVVGLGVGVATADPWVFGAGLALAGAGASGLFPLVFSSSTRIPGVAAGAGAATVSLAARLGFLVEPLIIGAIAAQFGLRWAFALVAAVAAVVALAASRIAR